MTSPVVLLSGDGFLVEEALDDLRTELGADPLAEAVFTASAPVADIIGALETPSLLGGVRLVVVHGAEALGKDHVARLESYLAQPSPHSVLVLAASGRTKLANAVKASGTVVSLEAPRGRRLVAWIKERARARGIKLDDRAGWTLVEAVGTELRDLDAALGQVESAFPGGDRVGIADVRSLFPRLADERIYAFTDAVGDRRLDAAMTALRRLLDQGDEPLMVFGALTAQMRRLLLARSVAEDGPRAVADALGLPEWRAERMHRQARSYRDDELAAAMGALAAADVEMKGGDLPPEIALERAVVQIVVALRDPVVSSTR